MKWLFDFKAGKAHLVLLEQSNNTSAIDVKIDGSALNKKSSFKILELSFSFEIDWCSHIISIANTASKKIEGMICSIKICSPEVAVYLYKSAIILHGMFFQVCAGVPGCYLKILHMLQLRGT